VQNGEIIEIKKQKRYDNGIIEKYGFKQIKNILYIKKSDIILVLRQKQSNLW